MKKARKTWAIEPKVVEAVQKEAAKTDRSESYVVNKVLSDTLVKK